MNKRERGIALIEVIIDLVVLSVLSMALLNGFTLWVEREKGRMAAAGANEIMAAVRRYYLNGDAKGERWPMDIYGIGRIQVLINKGYLRSDTNPTPYGGDYVLGYGGKRIALTFTVDNEKLAPYIALNVLQHGRASGKTITASMPRPNVHRNHDEILPLDGDRELEGTLNANGHSLTRLGELLRVDDPSRKLAHPTDHPKDYGYFPDDDDIAIAFANTTTIIGRWPSTEGNPWKVVNASTDTTRNHVIPLRTEVEWVSFRDQLVKDTPELTVCEIEDVVTNSCVALQPETLSLMTSASSVVSGTNITLTWSSQNMGSCTLRDNNSATGTPVGTSGSDNKTMTSSLTFYFQCTGNNTGIDKTANVHITVTAAHVHVHGGWSPSTDTECDDVYMTQHASCHVISQMVKGTNLGEAPWLPLASEECLEFGFIQYDSKCGFKRNARGTYQPNWTPDPSTKCGGISFRQDSKCGYRFINGTAPANWTPARDSQCEGQPLTQSTPYCASRETTGTKPNNWGPPTNTYCENEQFEQTNVCGDKRNATGIKAHNWLPNVVEVCDGLVFEQKNACGKARDATGIAPPNWTPDASNYCVNINIEQTSNVCENRYVWGTDEGTWSPDASTQCAAKTFDQESTCGQKRSIFGAKTLHHAYIEEWYGIVFERPSDPDGLCGWAAEKENGRFTVTDFVNGARDGDCFKGAAYSQRYSWITSFTEAECKLKN